MEDWTEKYRPKTLSDIIGNEQAISSLRSWARTWTGAKPPKKKAVVLSGKPGTGKTSSALALARDFNWSVIELNASDARNEGAIRKIATAGAVNETLDDVRGYLQSVKGERKLIVLDEADNLYEKSEKSETNQEFSDRGGKKAIIETIRVTCQPIVLIVNDYYDLIRGGGEPLKAIATVISFYDVHPGQIMELLKRICREENINADMKFLQILAERCRGDVRSAVRDLQSLCIGRQQVDAQALDAVGYRDREKIIFDALRDVFKSRSIQTIRDNLLRDGTLNVDLQPDLFLLWIVENLPREYRAVEDLVKGYDAVSNADLFLGRVSRRQYYGLWPYACDLMTGGVAVAKTRVYGAVQYAPPLWLREMKTSKPARGMRDSTVRKIGYVCHTSEQKSNEFILTYFTLMFRSDTRFACSMKKRLDLSEIEVEYLLGSKYAYKLKEILECAEKTDEKQVSIEEVLPAEKENGEKKELKPETKQPSLFDF